MINHINFHHDLHTVQLLRVQKAEKTSKKEQRDNGAKNDKKKDSPRPVTKKADVDQEFKQDIGLIINEKW